MKTGGKSNFTHKLGGQSPKIPNKNRVKCLKPLRLSKQGIPKFLDYKQREKKTQHMNLHTLS